MKSTINNNKVIIINGTGGSGKDTFVELCKKNNSKVMQTSMINFSKDIARYCGWNGEKAEKDRKFLSDMNDILIEWADLPYKGVSKFITACKNKIIFVHSRDPEDIERLKDEFDAVTLLIINDRVQKIETNHADRDVEDYAYDYIVYNNASLEDLENSAKVFMSEVQNNGKQ